MNRLQRKLWNHKQDRLERRDREAAAAGACYFCAVSGQVSKATRGQLCARHFDEVNFPKPLPLPDY